MITPVMVEDARHRVTFEDKALGTRNNTALNPDA